MLVKILRNLIPFFGQKSTQKNNIFFLCVILFSNVISAPPKVAPGAHAPFCLPLATPQLRRRWWMGKLPGRPLLTIVKLISF